MVSVRTSRAALAVALLLAGCASAPKDSAHGGRQQAEAAPTRAPAGAGAAATGASAPTASATTLRSSASDDPANSPNLVVDVTKQPATEAENSGQVCRQMLRPNTNSIVTVCGTPAQWKKFEDAESHQAQELLLRMQNEHF